MGPQDQFCVSKSPSGRHRGNGLKGVMHVKDFAQDPDHSKCAGNIIQLLLLIC